MRKKLIMVAFFLSLASPRVFALGVTQDWQPLTGAAAPWQSAVAITAFQNRFIVLSDTGSSTMAPQLWLSADGESWQTVSAPAIQGNTFFAFAGHSGLLYGFAMDAAGNRLIFRTQNGMDWEPAGNLGAGSRWAAAVSFNGNIYAAAHSGETWRSSGAGAPPAWSAISFSADVAGTDPEFAVFAGNLYTVRTSIVFTEVFGTISSSADGLQWNKLYQEGRSDQNGIFGLVSLGDVLYWGGGFLAKTTLANPTQWADDVMFFDSGASVITGASPFGLFGRMYAVLYPFLMQPVVRMPQSDGTWITVSNTVDASMTGNFSDRGNRQAVWKDHLFLVAGKVWVLRFGARSILQVPLRASLLVQGDSKLSVLAISPRIQTQDNLLSWRIRNFGSATAGMDIKSLSLFRVQPGDPGVDQPSEFLGTLKAQNDTTWVFTSTGVKISDQDVLVVVANMASDAQPGRTLRMGSDAGAMTWDVSTVPSASPAIEAAVDQTIATASGQTAVSNIDGVEAAPQPAKDDVHFFYTLPEPSDVRIRIFDHEGRRISDITDDGKLPAAHAETVWDTRSVGSGTYFADVTIHPASGGERRYQKKISVRR